VLARSAGERQPAQEIGQLRRVELLGGGGQVRMTPPAVAGHRAPLNVVEASEADLHVPDAQEIVLLSCR
jgi:hypothetical protein